MGIFGYALSGAGAGFGTGLMQAGAELGRNAAYDEQMARMAAHDQNTLQRQLLLEQMREKARGGGGSSRLSPADELQAFADKLGVPVDRLAAAFGGMQGQQADDARAIVAGNVPTVQIPLNPSDEATPDRQDDLAAAQASGAPTSISRPKYTEGQAAQMAQDWAMALRRAMGLVKPEAADNIAKAENQETQTGYLKRYVDSGGEDTTAAQGVLLNKGKDLYGVAGDVVT